MLDPCKIPACPYTRFIAFDVAKKELVYFEIGQNKVGTVANQPKALAALVKTFGPDCLVICEPTGGYERALIEALAQAGVPTHRADTLKSKAFMRSYGTLGKSDPIDARGLASYAHDRWQSLPLWTEREQELQELQALRARRDDLVALRTAERNRAGAPQSHTAGKAIARSFAAIIRTLATQIQLIESQIETLIKTSRALQDKTRIMRSLKGIGAVTASSLCALMPELGSLPNKKAVALAGLAPHPNESGSKIGYRSVQGGRPQVRKALFMAALAASHAQGLLKDFYDKLVARGKKKIVAIVAVMRKIIVILNARLRDDALSKAPKTIT